MPTRMKLRRIEKEKTQIDLWGETGIPQWRLSLIERGLPPRCEEAKKIAAALGSTSDELFSSNNQKNCSTAAIL